VQGRAVPRYVPPLDVFDSEGDAGAPDNASSGPESQKLTPVHDEHLVTPPSPLNPGVVGVEESKSMRRAI